MEQFTASEVRDAITWKYGDKLTRISAMLTAYADMLEAQEKAVPVASISIHAAPGGLKGGGEWLAAARKWMQSNIPNGDRLCWSSGEVVQVPFCKLEDLARTVAIAAVCVPTMRYFIGGPRACAYVDKFEHVEAVITALCKCTGDDRDDYTSTDLIVSERVR